MSISKPFSGSTEPGAGTDIKTEYAADLNQLHEGVRARNQLFESVKVQLIDKIQDVSVQRAISTLEGVVPSHKLEAVAEKASIPLTKGNSDSETVIIAATDIAKRKLDLQHRLTIASEETEVKALTKLLQIARVAEETLVQVCKALTEKPAARDLITTKEVVMRFGDEAFKKIRPLLNENVITIPLYSTDKTPVVEGQHRSFVKAILAAEESLVLKQEETERATHERMDRIALFRKLASNMRRNANAFRGNGVDLRINQLEALHALSSFLQNEGYGDRIGYYKQPTGAGKTFLFGIIIRLMDVKTLVLVPRTNLRKQARDELVEAVGLPAQNIQVIEPGTKVADCAITINTYQNHISRMNNDSVYQEQMRKCELVICDEAHKSLGTATKESIEALDGEFDENMTEDDEKSQQNVLEHINQYTSKAALKLGFTATPELAKKSALETYRVPIAESTYSDMVKAKIIKKFKVRQVSASISPGEIDGHTITLDKEVALLHRENIYMQLLLAYKEAKEELDEELYPLATCATIDECDVFARVAEDLGLRPVIVTGREYQQSPKIDHTKRAEEMLLKNEKDIIVTVDKLKEGWNFRPLNAVILARATLSPANILQPAGRASRTYQHQKFAYIFEASWHPQHLHDALEPPEGKKRQKGKGGRGGKRHSLYHRKPLTFAEALYVSGENDVNSVCEGWEGEKLKFKRIYRLDHNSEVNIDGIDCIGLNKYAELYGMNAEKILEEINKAGLPIMGQARSGLRVVDVYNKAEVEKIEYVQRRKNILHDNGEITINGIPGVAVGKYAAANDLRGPTLLEEVRVAGLPVIGISYSGIHPVDIYEKEKVDQLPCMVRKGRFISEDGEVVINGVTCIAENKYADRNGMTFQTLHNAIVEAKLPSLGKARSGPRVVDVYEKAAVEQLECIKRKKREVDKDTGEVDIDGVKCIAPNVFASAHEGLGYLRLLREIEEADLQPAGEALSGTFPAKVYRKDEIEKLPGVIAALRKPNEKGDLIIDGHDCISIVEYAAFHGIHYQSLKRELEESDITVWGQGESGNASINFYDKTEVEKLPFVIRAKRKVDEGTGEISIDGTACITPYKYAKYIGTSYDTLITEIQQVPVFAEAMSGPKAVKVYEKSKVDQLPCVVRAKRRIDENGEVTIDEVCCINPHKYAKVNGLTYDILMDAINGSAIPVFAQAMSGNALINVYEKSKIEELPYVKRKLKK